MGMKLPHMILYFLLLPSLFADDDAPTMLTLRASLSPSPSPSWTTSDSFCTWSGVQCDTSTRVTSINLSTKSLSGALPNLTPLSHLTTLSLQHNLFNGPIPRLSGLQFLQHIHLDYNAFSSVPTDAFEDLPTLQTLTLTHNPSLFQWEFPRLSDSPNLTVFEAVNTSLIGSFPSLFFYPKLRVLRLSYNQLKGAIQQESGYNYSLETLWLDHQEPGLSGGIDFLAIFDSLTHVWLNDNAFSGPIPDLSNCTNIVDLQLGDNQLVGFVPNSLSSLPNLVNISLQSNNLFGPFPNFSTRVKVESGKVSSFCSDKPGLPCNQQVITLLDVMETLGYPGNLMEAWRGKDACIWSFIGCDNDGNITIVNFSNQGFEGEIPDALGKLTALQELYLNGNAFSGSIPESLTALHHLKVLDVSNNYLTGKMPGFQARVSIDGNVLVADESVFEAASESSEDFRDPSLGFTLTSLKHSSILGLSVKAFIPVCAVLATLVLILCICTVLCILSKRKRANQWEEDQEEELSGSQSQMIEGLLRRFSYESLKSVTESFDPKRKLGGGGFGSVYEGSLADGTKVAVKRLDRVGQGKKEFVAEVKTLGTIHHVNLVKLIGFCDQSGYKLLVYEYMINGSLDKWIFPNQLSWNTRKKIVLQIAKGLAYLHEECEQRIAHLDIKPQNILLDGKMDAKVGDFGLAKLIGRDESFVMTAMRGTRGYLAPEWLSQKITEKADVYGFGIVLLEVVYGRRNLEYSTYHDGDEEEESGYDVLMDVVKKKAEANRLSDLFNGSDDGMKGNSEEVEKLVKIGIWCLHDDPTTRPAMSVVVKALEGEMEVMGVELEYGYTSTNVADSLGGSSEQGHSSLVSASVLSGPR